MTNEQFTNVAETAWNLANEPDTDFAASVTLRDCAITIKELQSRIAELEKDLVKEAARTAAQKLRADQLDKQHSMQAKMHAEAASKVAELERDAARFKWCVNQYGFTDFIIHDMGKFCDTPEQMRQAIDTAMQKD